MEFKSSLLLAAAVLSCLAMASAQDADLLMLRPEEMVNPSNVDLASVEMSPEHWWGLKPHRPWDRNHNKTCLSDHTKSVATFYAIDSWVKRAQPNHTFTSCRELCPVLDMYDALLKNDTSGSDVFVGQGWTAMDIGNGPEGVVPTGSMYASWKVNRVFGLCAVLMPVGPNGTVVALPGTEASVTLVKDIPGFATNGTVFPAACLTVDTTGTPRIAPSMSGAGGPYACACQRMCHPHNRLCNKKVWWGGRSCGSCPSDIGRKKGVAGDAGCGCRVNRWDAFWAGWHGKNNGMCYANVLTPANATGLMPPTDFMTEPRCRTSCP